MSEMSCTGRQITDRRRLHDLCIHDQTTNTVRRWQRCFCHSFPVRPTTSVRGVVCRLKDAKGDSQRYFPMLAGQDKRDCREFLGTTTPLFPPVEITVNRSVGQSCWMSLISPRILEMRAIPGMISPRFSTLGVLRHLREPMRS